MTALLGLDSFSKALEDQIKAEGDIDAQRRGRRVLSRTSSCNPSYRMKKRYPMRSRFNLTHQTLMSMWYLRARACCQCQ